MVGEIKRIVNLRASEEKEMVYFDKKRHSN